YERLHLHTVKRHSALPGMAFPADAPRYVSRRRVVDYLGAYATQFGITPRFGVEARAIVRTSEGWRTLLVDGSHIDAAHVVVATGANRHAQWPTFGGADVFAGRLVHSADYRNAAPFAGQRVLVVGMGNTGAEIALDLCEHGVAVALSVRSPVNIVYRDVLGRATQESSMMLGRLPTAWGDALASFFRDRTVGNLSRYGIATPRTSPMADLRERGRTPVIDVGTVAKIRSGAIRVHPGIERLTENGAVFTDGSAAQFDVLLAATGYRSGIEAFFTDVQVPVDASGLPTSVIGEGALAGVYFVGFDTHQPGGLLRSIGLQAHAVAQHISGAATK
ncbi:MAG: NAD(P)/FAD-dependent oxidoreductase, partial [Variovorax sp.]